MEEVEEEEPKPLVDYIYLPESQNSKPNLSIIDKILKKTKNSDKMPINFGSLEPEITPSLKKQILSHYSVKNEKNEKTKDTNLETKDSKSQNSSFQKEENEKEEKNENKNESFSNKIFPLTHKVTLTHTLEKPITSIDVDRTSTLLATSSYDGTIKIWDFNSLRSNPSPNHIVDCGNEGEFPVVSVSWSASGGFLLVCSTDCQAKILSRNGENEISCVKGDLYLVDIKNTKGHTFPLTDGKFHPIEKNLFITSSRDSTIRIWDIYSKQIGIDRDIMQSCVLRVKTLKNKKIPVNTCNYNINGNLIAGGVNDGSIQIFSNKSWRPEIYIQHAHEDNSEISSILFVDDFKFLSRADDSTMKLWDMRNVKETVFTWDNLPFVNSKMGMTLNSFNNIVLTGTSPMKKSDYSYFKFYSLNDFSLLHNMKLSHYSPTSILWNSKLNQIFLSDSNGECSIYFDPEISNNGIINSIFKKTKIKDVNEENFSYVMPVITPLQLPLFEEINFSRQTYLDKINGIGEDKLTSEMLNQAPEFRFNRQTSVTQHIMRNINKAIYKEGDVQEMLKKFAGKGEWVDNAYKDTQPNTVLDKDAVVEDEVRFYEETKRKLCPHCGLKFCTCKKSIFQIPISQLRFKKNN